MDNSITIGIVAATGGRLGLDGGLNVYVRSLVEAVAQHGEHCRYVVLCGGEPDQDWREKTWPEHVSLAIMREPRRGAYRLARLTWVLMGAEKRRRWTSFDGYWRDLPFVEAVQREGIDAVHFPSTTMPVQWCPLPAGLTFFDMQHEYMPDLFSPKALASRRKAYRPSVERASRVAASSEFTAGTLVEKYGLSRQGMDVIPVGIGAEYGERARCSAAATRAKHGLSGTRYAIFPANPWPHKNHVRLLAALRVCRDTLGQTINLVCTGRLQDQVWSAEMLSTAAGVEGQVWDLGFLPAAEVSGLVAGAEFMVFPSLFEGFGIPLLEAMASGCPVCAADSTSIPELLGGCGLLFDPLSVEAIAEAMVRMWTDSSLREGMRARGLARSRLYGWDRVVPMLEEFYGRLVVS